jgi:RNA polymerase subunit RPABC4/transcription elongation factor Spt4
MRADRQSFAGPFALHQSRWRVIVPNFGRSHVPQFHVSSSTPSASLLEPQSEQLHCPYCHSTDVRVPAKQSASTYRRCESCGQLWHPDRLPANANRR